MKKTLLSVSFFTLAAACWLTFMEIVLRHPGYLLRVGVSVSIALISLATIAIFIFKSGTRDERWLWAGALILIGIGGQAFLRNARGAHFEGFVFLISAVLLFQGVLMLLHRRGRWKVLRNRYTSEQPLPWSGSKRGRPSRSALGFRQIL